MRGARAAEHRGAVISNQPQAAPSERPPEPRTPLNAVFRRLSDGQSAAPAEPPPPPARPAARSTPPAPSRPVPPIEPELTPEPAPSDPRVSFAAAVLARAGAAIAARAVRDAEAAAAGTPAPKPPPPASSQAPETAAAPEPAEALPEPVPVATPEPETATVTEPKPEPDLETQAEPRSQPEPEPQPEPAPAADAVIVNAAEPVTAAPERQPSDKNTLGSPKAAPRPAPAAAFVPAWLVAPVLRIAIPDSPFGRGNVGRLIGEAAPATPAAPAAPAADPDTIGFAEVEPRSAATAPPTEIVKPDAAADVESASASEPIAASLDEVADIPEAQIPPATEPAAEPPSVSSLPVAEVGEPEPAAEPLSVSPLPGAEAPEAEPAAEPPSVSPQPGAEARDPESAAEPPWVSPLPVAEAGEPEPAAEPPSVSPLSATQAGEPEPTAEAFPPEPASRRPESAATDGESEAPAPPPRAARPLGAPQAGLRPVAAAPEAAAAGLPAAELPPLVEPEAEPFEATDTAVGPTRDDRPTTRNRRLYRRVGIDAEFEINGIPAKLLDLSMGGFAAANAPTLAPNAVVPVTVRLAIDGVDISTRMRARIVYAETPRSGGRFIDLTASQTAFLRYVVTWRGQSVGALGTATLLEAITRGPERHHPTERPSLEPPGRAERRTPWWSRMFGWFRARGAP